jgi:RecB family exonuclease
VKPIYILKPPGVPAGPPPRWSISSLASFRVCPRRWWLLNSRYTNTPNGNYPVPYGAATLRGRLVHSAVEAFVNSKQSATGESTTLAFSPRQYFKKALRKAFDKADENPRTDPRRLSVSIDDCVSDFYDLVESQDFDRSAAIVASPDSRRPSNSKFPPSEAAELWIEVDDPPLGGRIDRVINHGLVDFKTGDPADDHAEQMVFYAVLWWLKYGVPPRAMRLLYAGGVKSVNVPVPSTTQLRTIQERLREEIGKANQYLNAGLAPARPSVNNCGRCPVRQLCDEYWKAPETVPLRHPRSPVAKDDGAFYCDVRIVELPSPWARDGHLFGAAVSDVLGKIYLFVEREQCPVESSKQPSEARLLSAKIHSGLLGFEVRPTHSSVVFWELPPGA